MLKQPFVLICLVLVSVLANCAWAYDWSVGFENYVNWSEFSASPYEPGDGRADGVPADTRKDLWFNKTDEDDGEWFERYDDKWGAGLAGTGDPGLDITWGGGKTEPWLVQKNSENVDNNPLTLSLSGLPVGWYEVVLYDVYMHGAQNGTYTEYLVDASIEGSDRSVSGDNKDVDVMRNIYLAGTPGPGEFGGGDLIDVTDGTIDITLGNASTNTSYGGNWFSFEGVRVMFVHELEYTKARYPKPDIDRKHVVSDVVLMWRAGDSAISHDVYFGTDYNVVNDATRGGGVDGDVDGNGQVNWGDVWVVGENWLMDPAGLQPSPDASGDGNVDLKDFAVVADGWKQLPSGVFKGNREPNSFAPGTLQNGKTYHWRIDEVSATETYKGDVWSFRTVEPGPRRERSRVVLLRTLDVSGFGAWTMRLGDLNRDGRADILLAQNSGQNITCLTAIEPNGTQLWQVGTPNPGNYDMDTDLPLQIYDIDLDGYNEVIYVVDGNVAILNGSDGVLEQSGPLPASDANDCLVIANFAGYDEPRNILVKNRFGEAWALDSNLDVVWNYTCNTGHYPWPYDTDGDGRDELMLGFTLVDDDGTKIWEALLPGHAESVAIGDVDGNSANGVEFAVSTYTGDVFALVDSNGQIAWQHGVEHAQHIIIGDFRPELAGLEVCGLERGDDRSSAATDAMILYSAGGTELWREVRTDPSVTSWATIISAVSNWDNRADDLILGYRRGGSTDPTLYDGNGEVVATFPFVPFTTIDDQHFVQHADIWGDAREEIIVYNEELIYIYTNGAANPKIRLYNDTHYIGMP